MEFSISLEVNSSEIKQFERARRNCLVVKDEICCSNPMIKNLIPIINYFIFPTQLRYQFSFGVIYSQYYKFDKLNENIYISLFILLKSNPFIRFLLFTFSLFDAHYTLTLLNMVPHRGIPPLLIALFWFSHFCNYRFPFVVLID